VGFNYHIHNCGVLGYIEKSGCYEYALQHYWTSGIFTHCIADPVGVLLDHQKTNDNGTVYVDIYGRLADIGGS